MPNYICWGDDKEDLSDRVREAIARAQARGDWNFGVDDDSRERLEIVVHCSKDHRNVFEV